MAECGKRYGPRRLVCVKPAGHAGKHTRRSASRRALTPLGKHTHPASKRTA
jgi:hypothetical protein